MVYRQPVGMFVIVLLTSFRFLGPVWAEAESRLPHAPRYAPKTERSLYKEEDVRRA